MIQALTEATIVVIDDDYNATYTTAAHLRQHAVRQIYTFLDVDSLLNFAQETAEQIDIFLLDIHMPQQSGYALIKVLRQMPKFTQSKFVALTGGVLFTEIRQAKAAGFDAFLGKPIKMADFPQQLNQILAGEAVWDW